MQLQVIDLKVEFGLKYNGCPAMVQEGATWRVYVWILPTLEHLTTLISSNSIIHLRIGIHVTGYDYTVQVQVHIYLTLQCTYIHRLEQRDADMSGASRPHCCCRESLHDRHVGRTALFGLPLFRFEAKTYRRISISYQLPR